MNRIFILLALLFSLSWNNGKAQSSESEDNYCVEFGGKNGDDKLDLGASNNLYLNHFTIEVWVYPYMGSTTTWQGLLGGGSGYSNDRPPSMIIWKNKIFQCGFGTTDSKPWSATSFSAENTITSYAWNHLAFTFDGLEMCMYVNGALVAKSDACKDKTVRKIPIRYFGQVPAVGGGGYSYKGMIDDIRIWSYARTEEQISDNMKVLLSGSEAGLIGYWTFNDQKLIAVDKSSRGNNGTILGSSIKFVKMPLGDEDALYVVQQEIPIQTIKIGQTKDTCISWTFGHKTIDAYKVTLSDVSDASKARVIVSQKDYGDSTSTTLSLKGLKEGMITAKLNFDYGKYHLEHTFLIDVKTEETGQVANHTNLGKNQAGELINGSSLYTNGVYSILDNGGLVSTTANDGGTLVSWKLSGDGDLQARILNEGDVTTTAAYGLEIREDVSVTDTKSFGVFVAKGKQVLSLARTQSGASNQIGATANVSLPIWLRLNRTGNLLTAYTSTNPSASWTKLSSLTLEMSASASIGLMVASGNSDKARKKIKFDNVTLSGSLSLVNPMKDLTIMASQTVSFDKVFSNIAGTSYKVSVSPAGVVNVGIQDKNLVFNPLSTGSVKLILTAENGNTQIQDSLNVEVGLLNEAWVMADIWKTPSQASGNSFATMIGDQVRINSVVITDKTASDATNTSVDGITFVGTKKTKAENENQEITVYVKELDITGENVRAGLMFRDSLYNGAAEVALSCTAYEGIKLEYRWLKNVRTDVRTISGIKPPCWLKLTSYKGAYNAYYSTEAENVKPSNWVCVLGTSLIIQMEKNNTYVGVFSNTNSYHQGTANFTNLKLNSYDGTKIACTRTSTAVNEVLSTNTKTLTAYPNPFVDQTQIQFTNTKKGKVDIRLYNSAGVELALVYSGIANEGVQTYDINLAAMPTGMYYCKVITSAGVEVVKLMQIK